jgi:hypothetical protein
MSKLKQRFSENLFNIPGWRTNRKIIVIESDDWGSIRMPSRDVYETCLKQGYRVDRNLFSRYDSLASEEDLTLLFELLLSFKDWKSNHPVITANCLVANPNFEKIQASNFSQYHFELLTETFSKYPNHKKCFEIWHEGIRLNIFKPQSHGREHLNVSRFMNDLKAGDEDAHFAFKCKMPGIFKKNAIEIGNDYIVSLEHFDNNDEVEKELIVKEGLILFRELFGYSSKSFIASNYIWDPKLEHTLKIMDVQFIQGSKYQYIPKGNYSGFHIRYHFLGLMNALHQIYLIRNVYFEPSLNRFSDTISSAMRQIETAFIWHKPAIISMHRINFVGYIDQTNRDRTLVLFGELLKMILRRWPDVEFMSTNDLGDLIADEKIIISKRV